MQDHVLAIEPIVPVGCERPVSETLPVVVERIVRELQPEMIVLFGSYAEGTPTAHSDVDLLVILNTDAPSKDRSWAVSRLLIPRPFPVDILVRTPQEVEQGLAKGDAFLCQIMTSGKVLYERRK
jgi:predicted nucleotidyltransferase